MRAAKVPPKELRRVVIAASVGNIIEWYDFYIFGSLAAILAVKFFQKGHPVAAFLSTVAIFSVGFLIRPLGAFVFGWLGDKVGRKYTFIGTLTGMGVSTAVIGMVPTYAQIGLSAAIILFALRLIQGLCPVAGRDHWHAALHGRRGLRRLGLARAVPHLPPAGRNRYLPPAVARGDAG